MIAPGHPSFARWYSESPEAPHVSTKKSPGGILDLLEVTRPQGTYSRPALPDIVLFQDLIGGSRVSGDLGGGRFDVRSKYGDLACAAPNFAAKVNNDASHRLRCLAFPIAQWKNTLDQATDGQFSFDSSCFYGRVFASPVIRILHRNLWALSEDEGAPSRLLARAAGCEILAELCRLSDAPFTPVKGGLAPRTRLHCQELMRARLSEDISLDELAAEAQLSPFHFARMFKQSLGVPPRVYLTQLRMEKACELLEQTDLPITEIAIKVGYSSNQVLARVFSKHLHMSPSNYRRAVRAQVRIVGAN